MVARVLIMAGGTGGHVFPALAVARRLREQGVEVTWLGTRRGLEARVVPAAGFPIEFIDVAGLRGKGTLGWLLAPWRLTRATWQALGVCRRSRAGAVLGLGGFVTGPGGVAAWLLRRPLVIHEQNAVAGLTNRLLARLARRVLEAFPGSFPAGVAAETVGNPVREEILALPSPAERFAGRTGPLRVLIVGGSLGAAALNETVPAALTKVAGTYNLQIRHQAGRGKAAPARAAYARAGLEAEVGEFIDDMAEALGWADIVICRAGALTVSELAAAGLGAVLVPYPHAVDDHQTRNALYLSEAGAARLLLQAEMSADHLADLLEELFARGREGLQAMAETARRLARPEATHKVAAACLEVQHG